MKKHSFLSKILTFVLCTAMLVVPLFVPAAAAGEAENDPIVIDRLPYSVTQEFYKIDTGRTEDVVHTDENGNEVVETVPVYDKHYSYYYKYVATRAGRMTVQIKADGVYCSASVMVNGSSAASIYTDGKKSAYADLREGDVVLINLGTAEDTKVTMDLSIADYPKGSKYNPIETTFSELGSGIAVNLSKDDSFYYTFTVPETGVIQFYTEDAFSSDGDVSASMPFQQQIVFNEDRVSAFTSFMSLYKLVVTAGQTITMAVECPGYAVAGGYTLFAEYVPPFVLDENGQGDVFSGMYAVEYTSNEDGSKHCMYAVRFSYGKKTITVMNVKDCIFLGTYNWEYNTENGALDIPGAPYGITVVEDPSQEFGCYLKLHMNGSYAMKPIEEAPEPSDVIATVLNGKYEDIYKGKVYEVLSFDYAAGTLTIAKDWNSKGTVYTMGDFDVFTGEMTYTSAKGEEVVIAVSNGKVIYYNNPLTPVEAPHVHEYTTVVTAPTCTENGYTTFTCECGDTYKGEEVVTSGHKYEDVVTEPTCTEGGFTTHTCSACGDVKVDSETAAIGHHYSAWTDAGEQHKQTCANCNDEIVADHTWDEGVTVKEPTEEENGEKKRTCADCGAVNTQVIPALGHTHRYTSKVTAPTCTEAGFTTFTCSCGDSYKEAGEKALGHSYKDAVTAPTCTEGGYTTHTCTVCGDVKTDNQTAAAGHSYSQAVTAPTCTEGGYTTFTCSVCGHSYQDKKTSATGHGYDNGVEAEGQIVYTCTACGHSYSEEIVINEFTIPGTLTGTVNGSMVFTGVATESGYLVIDNVSALTGVYLSVTINGADAYPTENGFAVSAGDAIEISVMTYSEIQLSIPVYMYEAQQGQPDTGAMEFDVSFNGWNIYEQNWAAPFTGTATFIIKQSNVNAGDLTFRVIGVDGQFYNQYEFGLDADGNQFVSVKVTEGDVLTIVAYEETMQVEGQLHISVMEGEPELHVHTYDDGVVTAPTCTTDGFTTYTCTVCADSYQDAVVKAAHSYGEGVVTAPTCTEGGYTTYTCTACGDSYVEAGDKATDHSYGQWEVVKEATTTEPGSQKRACVNCGVEETQEIPMIEQAPTTAPATQPATQPATTAPATQPAATQPTTVGGDATAPSTTLIVVIVAVVLIAGAVAVVIVIKKKK